MAVRSVSNEVHIETGWLTALGGVIAASIGAFGVWLAQRLVGKAAWQTAISDASRDLLKQLQDERQFYKTAMDKLSIELEHAHELRELERDARNAERIATSAERAQLRGEIINLTQVVEGLKRQLREAGIPVPERKRIPYAPGEQVMVILEQSPTEPDDEG